jgi:23S rRNA (guanine745-N1)-methyltransferase
MVAVLCPVRSCGAPLERRDRSWVCDRGHTFDVARSDYCNLLQPQDSRSRNPGDPKEAALARRRFLEAGHGEFLLKALLEEIGAPASVLDVGCGEGYFLGSLAQERAVEAHGVDLSVPAIDLAARRWPGVSWWVVNADRASTWHSRSRAGGRRRS